MGAWLRNLWMDQGAFLLAIGIAGARLRGLIAVASALVLTGQIDLGKFGWWGSVAALVASQFIAAGEPNDPTLSRRVTRVEAKILPTAPGAPPP